MIKSVHIENYRSIKDLYIEPENLCAIIGSNSVGKTNVLKAIDLVLGEGWATKAKVVKELFNDTNEAINIRIDFCHGIPHDYYGTQYHIHYVTLKMEMYPEFKCEVRLKSNDTDRDFYITEEFKRKCHFIYISSDRDLAEQMRVSSWTLIGKLMKEVYNNYVNFYNGNEEKLRETFKELMVEPRQFLEDDFDEKNITFKKFSDCFTKHCENNAVGLAAGMKPELNIYNLNWFYKTLQITITESHTDKVFDSDEVGSGMQNLVLLSIFQTYAELIGGNVIFGVEEPEIYLYPQAQRALYKSFQKISKTSQIFYTSHNPNFIDASRAYELEILKKTTEEGTINLKKNSFYINKIKSEQERFRIYTHFNTERNEVFFAKKVLILEGDSDKIFYQTICEEHWDYDLDKNGVSILSCGGKGGVSYFTGLCEAMGIENYYSIWDADEKLDNVKLLEKTVLIGKGLELNPNLEVFLNEKLNLDLSGESSVKVKQAYEIASNNLTTELSNELFNELKLFLHK
ncbi:Predicted ATP-dependent endonuclease of the OLD family, contains P-loop ATPase and TOPRIM domains [Flavobacteriaceae bacterium MAR_2010_188]|nr:Predicted ATP-dependent endonuclease of the OLD family, contains P-loop ATPase and TOPRIM domains [Flavobacteriaceae bacterium MAR_2010_188]